MVQHVDLEEVQEGTADSQISSQRVSVPKSVLLAGVVGTLLLACTSFFAGAAYTEHQVRADIGAVIEEAAEGGFGKEECPCIGIDGMQGEKKVEGVGTYPADLGAHCNDWDNVEGKGEWRKEKWCYVDPCNCKLPVPPKQQTYMPDARFLNKNIYYSYNTCGAEDLWTKEHNPEACPLKTDKDACAAAKKEDGKKKCAWNDDDDACVGIELAGECTKDVPEEKYGKKSCRCAGIEHQKGEVKFDIDGKKGKKGKKVGYPLDIGSTCEAWDSESSNPACQGDEPADWCKKKFCYVNPCECDLDVGPFKATYGDGKWTLDGRPTYYSYVTCGETNTFADGGDAPKFERPESCPSSD